MSTPSTKIDIYMLKKIADVVKIDSLPADLMSKIKAAGAMYMGTSRCDIDVALSATLAAFTRGYKQVQWRKIW